MPYLRHRSTPWLPCIALAFALLPACKNVQAERVAFMQMQAAGDGFLLAGHTPDELTGEQRLGRVALIDTHGLIHHKLDERTVFGIEGITSDFVWITRKTVTKDLSANATDTLAPQPAIAKALAEHAVLSTSYDVLGTHEGKAVLEGADGRSYTIDPAGTIAKLAEGAAVREPAATTGGKRDQVPLALEPIPNEGSEREAKIRAELDNATMFSQSAAVLGEGSSDILVNSTTLVKGGVSSLLHRVSRSGEIVWSATVAELAAPVTIADAKVELVALTPLGDATWLLIRASKADRYDQTDYYEVEHRLVRLDAAAGKAAESYTVKNKG